MVSGELDCGIRVRLASFDRLSVSPDETRGDENYWRLIGAQGTISELPRQAIPDRVLVTFDNDPEGLGLACHNPISKSLWIKIDDLQRSYQEDTK